MDKLSEMRDEIGRFHNASNDYRARVHQTLVSMRTTEVEQHELLVQPDDNEALQIGKLLIDARQKCEIIEQFEAKGIIKNLNNIEKT
jgi:hypothetical protein